MTDARTRSQRIWFATCDSRNARLFHAHFEWPSRVHVTEADRYASAWTGFHEHGRPLMLGRGPRANATQHFADEHREPEEMAERFARDAVRWLDSQAGVHRRESLAVYAEGRMLGHLRAAAAAARSRIVLLHGNLASLRASELAAHPSVEELVRTSLSGARELPPPPVEAAVRARAQHAKGRAS